MRPDLFSKHTFMPNLHDYGKKNVSERLNQFLRNWLNRSKNGACTVLYKNTNCLLHHPLMHSLSQNKQYGFN